MNNRKLWLVIVLFSIIAGAGYAWRNWEELTVWPKKRVPLVESLRDPASVQFRKERLRRGGYLCGEVNAKNGTGGYTGFQRFVSYERGYAIEGMDASGWPDDDAVTATDLKVIAAEANWRKISGKPMDEDVINFNTFDAIWKAACRRPI